MQVGTVHASLLSLETLVVVVLFSNAFHILQCLRNGAALNDSKRPALPIMSVMENSGVIYLCRHHGLCPVL